MFHRILTSALIIFSSHFAWGQQIQIYKVFGGYRFEKDSIAISSKMVLQLMEENQAAYSQFKKATVNYNVSNILKFTGGAMMILPLATAAVGGEPEWTLAAGGLALILGSIPFNLSFQRNAVSALDIYNAGLASSSSLRMNFTFSPIGGTIKIRF